MVHCSLLTRTEEKLLIVDYQFCSIYVHKSSVNLRLGLGSEKFYFPIFEKQVVLGAMESHRKDKHIQLAGR